MVDGSDCDGMGKVMCELVRFALDDVILHSVSAKTCFWEGVFRIGDINLLD